MPAPAEQPDREPAQDLLGDPLLRDAPTLEGFKVLDPAVLYAKIGQGGMGAVYRGRHFKLDLDVAIKCLKPSLAAEDPDFVRRFEREARLAASIAHQNVVRVMDVQEHDGLHYLVMEFVRGETATERVGRKGALTEREALAILFGAAAGLAEAHVRGIVHRDVKPDNIMVSLEGRVKLADLGLARAQFDIDGRSRAPSSSVIMGTPQYMPPEQWESSDVTSAADVWALGATFFFLVTGRAGISGRGSYNAIARRIQEHDYPDLRSERPDLRPEVHALFERCVHRDPARRFVDARELLRELKRLMSDEEEVLFDPATGTGCARSGVVTPPPRQTLLRIRAQVERLAAAGPGEADTRPSPLPPDEMPTLPSRERRTEVARSTPSPLPRVVAAAAIAIVALAGWLVLHASSTRADVLAPTLRWLAPDPSDPVTAGPVTITGNVSDDGVVSQVIVDGRPAELIGEQWRTEVVVPAGGSLAVQVVAEDAAGNRCQPLSRVLRAAAGPARKEQIPTVAAWAEVLSEEPDPEVVTSAEDRARMVATGLPWQVRDRASGVVLLLVPPGTFSMGSPTDEPGRADDEGLHRVVVERPFYCAQCEVDQSTWERVMGDRPSANPLPSGPVEQVSHTRAVQFAERTGLRLLREAEWEYVCRAGGQGLFGRGIAIDTAEVNYDGDYVVPDGAVGESRGRPVVCGSLGRNAWGVADLHGNVEEWCADPKQPYGRPLPGPLDREELQMVVRGGSFYDMPLNCRCAHRRGFAPETVSPRIGFRVARDP